MTGLCVRSHFSHKVLIDRPREMQPVVLEGFSFQTCVPCTRCVPHARLSKVAQLQIECDFDTNTSKN